MWLCDLKDAITELENIVDPWTLCYDSIQVCAGCIIFKGSNGFDYAYDLHTKKIEVFNKTS